jgi:hypothetical protein
MANRFLGTQTDRFFAFGSEGGGGGAREVLVDWTDLAFSSIGATGSTPLILNGSRADNLSWAESSPGTQVISLDGVTSQSRTIRNIPQVQWPLSTLLGSGWFARGRTLQVAFQISASSLSGTAEIGPTAGVVQGTTGSGGVSSLNGVVPAFTFYRTLAGNAEFYTNLVFNTAESRGSQGYVTTDFDGILIIMETTFRQVNTTGPTYPLVNTTVQRDEVYYTEGGEILGSFDDATAFFQQGILLDDANHSTDPRAWTQRMKYRYLEATANPFA